MAIAGSCAQCYTIGLHVRTHHHERVLFVKGRLIHSHQYLRDLQIVNTRAFICTTTSPCRARCTGTELLTEPTSVVLPA